VLSAVNSVKTLIGEHDDTGEQTNDNSYGHQENEIAQPMIGPLIV
jgi:hypothetical protein